MRTECPNCGCDKVIVTDVGTDEKICRCLKCNTMVDYYAYESWIDKEIDTDTAHKMVNILKAKGCEAYCYCEDCNEPLYVARIHKDAIRSTLWQEDKSGKIRCNKCANKEAS